MFINRSKRRERGRAIDKERGLNRSIEWNSVVTIINYIVSTCTNIICSRHLIITIDDDNSIGSRPFAPVVRISRLLRQLISPRIKVKAGEEDERRSRSKRSNVDRGTGNRSFHEFSPVN